MFAALVSTRGSRHTLEQTRRCSMYDESCMDFSTACIGVSGTSVSPLTRYGCSRPFGDIEAVPNGIDQLRNSSVAS